MTLNCILLNDLIAEMFFRKPGPWTKFLSAFFPFNKQFLLLDKTIKTYIERFAVKSSLKKMLWKFTYLKNTQTNFNI